MVKDKLVKYNHRAGFYRMRKCAIISACFLFGAVAIALPVSLTINNSNTTVKAETPTSSEVEDNTNESSEEILSTY